jgi:hypothetical protein
VATLREVCPNGVDNEDKASTYLHDQQALESEHRRKVAENSETLILLDLIVRSHVNAWTSCPLLDLNPSQSAKQRAKER